MGVFWGVAIISYVFFFLVLEIPGVFFVVFFWGGGGGACTVDAGPEPTYEEKMRVPPPPGTVA